MVIVPNGGLLIADVKVLNKDIGFVRSGQAVAVKLEAFPFTRYGTLHGVIDSVGSDAVDDEKLGLVYPVRVRLDGKPIGRATTDIIPSSGMAVTADIRTGRRSILSYLLSPIKTATKEAGREN